MCWEELKTLLHLHLQLELWKLPTHRAGCDCAIWCLGLPDWQVCPGWLIASRDKSPRCREGMCTQSTHMHISLLLFVACATAIITVELELLSAVMCVGRMPSWMFRLLKMQRARRCPVSSIRCFSSSQLSDKKVKTKNPSTFQLVFGFDLSIWTFTIPPWWKELKWRKKRKHELMRDSFSSGSLLEHWLWSWTFRNMSPNAIWLDCSCSSQKILNYKFDLNIFHFIFLFL